MIVEAELNKTRFNKSANVFTLMPKKVSVIKSSQKQMKTVKNELNWPQTFLENGGLGLKENFFLCLIYHISFKLYLSRRHVQPAHPQNPLAQLTQQFIPRLWVNIQASADGDGSTTRS